MKSLITVFLLLFFSTAYADKTSIVLGVVPLYSAAETLEIWAPFAVYAENEQVRVIIRTERSTQDFESGLLSGKYDMAFMTARQHEKAKARYKAAAVPFEKTMRGAVIVRRDSGINSLKDLNQKQIAFASPDEYISSVVMRRILSEHGIEFMPVYLNSVSSVIIGTENQLYPAGSVLGGFYEYSEILKSIFVTEEYASYVVGFSPRVSKEEKEHLTNALLGMHNSKTARSTIKKLGITSFVLPEK